MSQDPYYDEDEARIRREIEKRYKVRQGLWLHFISYVLINVMLWLMWALATPATVVTVMGERMVSQSDGIFPWPMIVTLGWGIGMASHFLGYYYKYGSGAERREDAIQQEIERYREQYGYEKPKNRSRMELTEDGEIEEVYDESPSTGRRQRR